MDEYLRKRIYNQNPWWRAAEEIENDSKILEYLGNSIKFCPSILLTFNLEKEGVFTLRGPRQVGKSTSLKLLIKKLLLEKKVKPSSVFFYSADDLETPRQIYQMINEYFEILEEEAVGRERKYIFIDEITSVVDWQRGIKTLYEEGRLKNVFLLLSGSSAIDLRQGAERLPGRRGIDPYPDKIQLPLSFSEYLLHTRFPYLEILSSLPRFEEIIDHPPLIRKLEKLGKIQSYLKKWLNQYMLCGGFPRSINDLFSLKRITQTTYETYLTWLRGDIAKHNRSEHLARQILYEIAGLQTARVEWQTIAQKIEVEAHTTVMDYAHLLEDLFALRIFFQIDFNKKKIQPKKRKKIYFLDPLIFWIILGWNEKWGDFYSRSQEKVLSLRPALAESLVAQKLMGKDCKDWSAPSTFFWHNGGEVDFLTFNAQGGLSPLEVKYQEQVGEWDFLPFKKFNFKKGLIISKNSFIVKDQFAAAPLEVILSLQS